MQSVSSRIWTRVTVSNSYDDNDYTTGSLDILWVLLARFAPIAWSTTMESTILALFDFAWRSKFMQPGQNFFNLLVTVL